MEVTVSGMVRARRQEIKEQVERLRGCYAGGLTVGQTAAVVVDGMPDWLQPKLAAAAANDIPVVSVDWLEDSALHGFLLCPSNYRLLPGQSRRSSVASTNAGVSAAPAAPASLLPASLQLQPAAVQALLEPALGLLHSSGQGSPEVERLRGEQRPPEGSPMAAAFVCAENADDRTPHATGSTGPLAQDVLQRLQAAPDALRVQLPSPCSPVMSPGPGLLRLPTPLQPPSGGPLLAPAAADAETQNEGATPQPSDAPGGTASPAQQQAETDSDTMIARFLSRMPQVTVARGSCRPRGLSPDSSVGSSSCGRASLGCLLGSRDGHGAAERRDSCRLSGANSAAATLQGRPVAPQAVRQGHLEEAAPDQDPSYPAQASRCASECPPPNSPVEGRLPATTLIRLGAPSRRPPAASTLDGIAEMHSDGLRGDGDAVAAAVTFYESAEALPAAGPACTFVAGDTTHGARVLYEVSIGGEREYALALVQSIYRLGDEVWMEHRYLLSKEDLLQRPRWAAAARGMRAGELLLSTCSYHSPMHLICGDFQLCFPGHALRLGRSGRRGREQGQAQAQQAEQAAGRGGAAAAAAAVTCRRGFDTTAGEVVPLRRALEGFRAA